jgi:hypothetical protein
MATPPKISPLKESDLKIDKGAVDGDKLTEVFKRLFNQLNPYFIGINKTFSQGLSLSENVRCDLINATFSHGIAQDVALHVLSKAAGLIVLGANSHLVEGYTISMKSEAVATIAIWFNDVTASQVQCGLALFEDGQQSQTTPPTFLPGFRLTTPGGAIQSGMIYMGAGLPDNSTGNNGDYYFRTDTPGTSTQLIYVKSAGAWISTGGGSQLSRVYLTDANDVLVYHLDEALASGPWLNSGSAGTASLSVLNNGSLITTRAGLFPNGTGLGRAVGFSSKFNNVNIGGATAVEPAYPITLSFWWMHREYTSDCELFSKAYRPFGGWGSPFTSISLKLKGNSGDTEMHLSTGGGSFTITTSEMVDRLEIGGWNLLVGTYDGALMKYYVNGTLIGQLSVTGAIDYGTHGPWLSGQSPGGASGYQGMIDEIRVANVARSQAWVEAYWKTGMLLS